MKSLVACCSINFLAKFFSFDPDYIRCHSCLIKRFIRLEVLFSTEKDFFPDVEIEVSIFFFKSDEIVSVFFLFLSITLLIRYLLQPWLDHQPFSIMKIPQDIHLFLFFPLISSYPPINSSDDKSAKSFNFIFFWPELPAFLGSYLSN